MIFIHFCTTKKEFVFLNFKKSWIHIYLKTIKMLKKFGRNYFLRSFNGPSAEER